MCWSCAQVSSFRDTSILFISRCAIHSSVISHLLFFTIPAQTGVVSSLLSLCFPTSCFFFEKQHLVKGFFSFTISAFFSTGRTLGAHLLAHFSQLLLPCILSFCKGPFVSPLRYITPVISSLLKKVLVYALAISNTWNIFIALVNLDFFNRCVP